MKISICTFLLVICLYYLLISFLYWFQPIPDSLNTLTEFMSHMERTLSQNGDYAKALSCASVLDVTCY